MTRGLGLDLRWNLAVAKRKRNRDERARWQIGPGRPPRSRLRSEAARDRRARQDMVVDRYVHSLDSLRKVGTMFGISGERVRQLVALRYSPEEARKGRAHIRAMLNEADKRYRLSIAPPCKVCGQPSLRSIGKQYLTCSPTCARAWQSFARSDDEEASEQHRINMARSILRHQETKAPSQVEWAKRIVAAVEAGQSLPPKNRTMPRWSKKRPALVETSA